MTNEELNKAKKLKERVETMAHYIELIEEKDGASIYLNPKHTTASLSISGFIGDDMNDGLVDIILISLKRQLAVLKETYAAM